MSKINVSFSQRLRLGVTKEKSGIFIGDVQEVFLGYFTFFRVLGFFHTIARVWIIIKEAKSRLLHPPPPSLSLPAVQSLMVYKWVVRKKRSCVLRGPYFVSWSEIQYSTNEIVPGVLLAKKKPQFARHKEGSHPFQISTVKAMSQSVKLRKQGRGSCAKWDPSNHVHRALSQRYGKHDNQNEKCDYIFF